MDKVATLLVGALTFLSEVMVHLNNKHKHIHHADDAHHDELLQTALNILEDIHDHFDPDSDNEKEESPCQK